ncbi:hypothetical protein NSE01_33900 [Novosphingobium sediminis]|uniref:Cytochrome P450 n=1 Tax=Novosphingobium sediminis TaxID=707214 RepID=A0A512APC5_9SPHN|nr:hypothetical protein [Novosphingobium sediminis]GEO01558.1 hypothetical protein NSE01_33900 [Novosphingobium sediminis]
MQAPEVDGFFTQAALTDPLPMLAQARQHDPVFRSRMADGQEGFVVTRYEDIKAVYAKRREPHVLAHAFKAVRIRFDPVH